MPSTMCSALLHFTREPRRRELKLKPFKPMQCNSMQAIRNNRELEPTKPNISLFAVNEFAGMGCIDDQTFIGTPFLS